MVDYTFYKTVYLGSAVPEKAFPGIAAQAQARIEKLKRICKVRGGEESEKMALCAVCDALWAHSRKEGLKTATLGGVSVSYESGNLERAVYDAAAIYLDIYRGVAVC